MVLVTHCHLWTRDRGEELRAPQRMWPRLFPQHLLCHLSDAGVHTSLGPLFIIKIKLLL